MRSLSLLFLIVLFACNQQKGNKEIAKSDTLVSASTPATNNRYVDTMDVTVYNSYLDEPLKNYLSVHMKDWSLIPRQSWEAYWWDQYRKDKSLVSYISGDFNCDNRIDHAMILSDTAHNYSVWVFLAHENDFTATQLDNFERETGPVGIGLEIFSKGKQNTIQGNKISSVNIKCEGVTIIFFEKAAQSYYWDNGRVKMLQTGD
jgi:hypothetical protein